MINVPETLIEKKKEFKKQTAGYISAAFGLVVGLAWNDAIKAFIEAIFPLKTGTIVAKFVYAAILTFLVIWIFGWLNRFADKD